MQDWQDAREQIEAFSVRYNYDMSYQNELLSASAGAFSAFVQGAPMSSYRYELSAEAHYVARITTMLEEDCGSCTQLNVQMALEEGVERELLRTLIEHPESLPQPLRDVYAHTRAVLSGESIDAACVGRLREQCGAGGFAELAVCIAGSRLYPTVKRALMHAQSCQRLNLDL